MAKQQSFESMYRQQSDGTWAARVVIDGKPLFSTGGFESEAKVVAALDEFVRRLRKEGMLPGPF